MKVGAPLKAGDTVTINVPWADEEFPNCEAAVSELRNGGAMVVLKPTKGRSPRFLHISYIR